MDRAFSEEGLKSTGGLSNNSNGMPKHIRPIMDAAMVGMAPLWVDRQGAQKLIRFAKAPGQKPGAF